MKTIIKKTIKTLRRFVQFLAEVCKELRWSWQQETRGYQWFGSRLVFIKLCKKCYPYSNDCEVCRSGFWVRRGKRLPNDFDPARTFESPQHAAAIIKAQPKGADKILEAVLAEKMVTGDHNFAIDLLEAYHED